MNGFPCMFPSDMVEPYSNGVSGLCHENHAQSERIRFCARPRGGLARDGITLTRFVEDALRARLTDAGSRKPAFRLRLETVTGDEPPNVDISDRDALYDVIDRA